MKHKRLKGQAPRINFRGEGTSDVSDMLRWTGLSNHSVAMHGLAAGYHDTDLELNSVVWAGSALFYLNGSLIWDT